MGRPQCAFPSHRAQGHPSSVVGDLHLMFEAMDLTADAGLSLVVYVAEPARLPRTG